MSTTKVFIGMDVHKENTHLHVMSSTGKTLYEGMITTESTSINKRFRDFQKRWDIQDCVYEAGGAGYTVARQLLEMGISCQIAATSTIPRTRKDKVKTDRRDAMKLADYLRTGLLTFVHIPTAEEESHRTLVRTRRQIVKQLGQTRHYILKLLLRVGVVYRDGKKHWTKQHLNWLSAVKLDQIEEQISLQTHLSTLHFLLEQEHQLTEHIMDLAEKSCYAEAVGVLCCYRGINKLTAMKLLTEINDIRRFSTAPRLMSFTGLAPGEYSSGGRRIQTSITKAGNAYLRNTLIEIAWQYRHQPHVSVALAKRHEDQPAWAIQHSWRVQQRLHKKMVRLTFKKGSRKAVVAVARELTGFIWAALYGPELCH